ncbi:MAG: hypothetical protein JW913_19575 [Chitinispirillaceae bacterium]|nr:hypothetical protein [Chitinispirillaceae bacterium]
MNKHINAVQELTGYCRKKDAWNHIVDFSSYHKIIPQVDIIRIHEKNARHLRSEWFITLDGAPFSWIEIDTLQEERFFLQSEAVSGDFDILKGDWKIEDRKTGGINLSFSLEYELGIPVIEENCGDILEAKLQRYIDTLVEQQSFRIKENASEGRRFKRIPLNRCCSFVIDGRAIEANILNFSRGGMAINLLKGLLGTDPYRQAELQWEAVSSRGRLVFDQHYNTHHIMFSEPLNEFDFKSLFTRWAEGVSFSDEMIRIYEVMTAPSNGVPRQFTKMSAG